MFLDIKNTLNNNKEKDFWKNITSKLYNLEKIIYSVCERINREHHNIHKTEIELTNAIDKCFEYCAHIKDLYRQSKIKYGLEFKWDDPIIQNFNYTPNEDTNNCVINQIRDFIQYAENNVTDHIRNIMSIIDEVIR